METIVLILFLAATTSHALFLLYAKNLSSQSRKTSLWRIHLPLNGSLWGLLLTGIVLAQFQTPDFSSPPWLKGIGLLLALTGAALMFLSFRLLGFRQAMGLRFFFPEQTARRASGVYGFLRNPMYDGFILTFAGLGLILGITADFALTLASFLLLNVVLARVENYEFSWNPF